MASKIFFPITLVFRSIGVVFKAAGYLFGLLFKLIRFISVKSLGLIIGGIIGYLIGRKLLEKKQDGLGQ